MFFLSARSSSFFLHFYWKTFLENTLAIFASIHNPVIAYLHPLAFTVELCIGIDFVAKYSYCTSTAPKLILSTTEDGKRSSVKPFPNDPEEYVGIKASFCLKSFQVLVINDLGTKPFQVCFLCRSFMVLHKNS